MEEILVAILNELKSINSKLDTRTTESLPDVVTLSDLMNYLQVGRNKALEVINDKFFTQIAFGRKKGISKVQLLQWMERKQKLQKIGIAK